MPNGKCFKGLSHPPKADTREVINAIFYTDGWVLEIIEDLIEIGVTVLNPQHACMGTPRVGQIAGGRVCIRTNIDRQWVIPYGTPEEVVAAVKKAIGTFVLQRWCAASWGNRTGCAPGKHRSTLLLFL